MGVCLEVEVLNTEESHPSNQETDVKGLMEQELHKQSEQSENIFFFF